MIGLKTLFLMMGDRSASLTKVISVRKLKSVVFFSPGLTAHKDAPPMRLGSVASTSHLCPLDSALL